MFSDYQAIEEDLEMRQAALDSVKLAAEELLKQAGTEQDEAVKGERWFSIDIQQGMENAHFLVTVMLRC